MKKTLRIVLWILAAGLLLFFSFDVQSLEEHRAGQPEAAFDPAVYASDLWDRELPLLLEQAPALDEVLDGLDREGDRIRDEFGKQLGISQSWYYLVRGRGTVEEVGEEDLWVRTTAGHRVQVATDFIFGNAVRDASGLVSIDDFVNMTDFNNVSISLNRRVSDEVVAPLLPAFAPGKEIDFAGAFRHSTREGGPFTARIIPIQLDIREQP